MSEKSGGHHRHECPLCGASVPCAAPLPHRVGYRPEIRWSGDQMERPRFKLCEKCAARESKGMKGSVGGDVAILAQLIERGLPHLSAVDVLAAALRARDLPRANVGLDALYGRTEKDARRLALRDYERMRRTGERDAALTVMRRYPLAAFPSVRAVAQAAHRLRKPTR